MKSILPQSVLNQHTAVLGKTGSGKTSTVKLIVEQLVGGDHDARVCVIDPIKSDHWGLTLAADGKRKGLPFHILGGPFGHVPLNASAGDAIGKIIASGALRHSIIDMADFDMGEHAKFFIAFAQSLFKHMKGVLYLVVEEAHGFAPKERSGFGEESKATHWMKKLATGSRSKGIRLVVATQRTQELHNAVLGSCETLIVHRVTLPADQKPIMEWLRGNIDAEHGDMIAATLSSLKTGEGWVCSGEAKIIERRQFPRIATYDNSSTPTDDNAREVRPAPVDADALRSIIGSAVEEAKANDPAELKRRIAELEKQVKAKPVPVAAPVERVVEKRVEVPVLKAPQIAKLESAAKRFEVAAEKFHMVAVSAEGDGAMIRGVIKVVADQLKVANTTSLTMRNRIPPARIETVAGTAMGLVIPPKLPGMELIGTGPGVPMGKAERKILTALAQYPNSTKSKVSKLTGYAITGGGFNNSLSSCRSKGWIADGAEDRMSITPAGVEALGQWKPLPTGRALAVYWLGNGLGKAEKEIFTVLLEAYPSPLTKEQIAEATESKYAATGGGFNNALSRLRTLELISGKTEITASAELFEE